MQHNPSVVEKMSGTHGVSRLSSTPCTTALQNAPLWTEKPGGASRMSADPRRQKENRVRDADCWCALSGILSKLLRGVPHGWACCPRPRGPQYRCSHARWLAMCQLAGRGVAPPLGGWEGGCSRHTRCRRAHRPRALRIWEATSSCGLSALMVTT